jgi:hypothetical protein
MLLKEQNKVLFIIIIIIIIVKQPRDSGKIKSEAIVFSFFFGFKLREYGCLVEILLSDLQAGFKRVEKIEF